MAGGVKVRAPYRSEVRSEQARRTRHRIIEAARHRFVAGGYGATSVSAIASAARVAPDTIYDSFGTKRALLEAVIQSEIAGEDEASADILARPWVKEILAVPDLREQLARFARHTARTLSRMRPLHALIRAGAAADHELAELHANVQESRFQSQARIMSTLAAAHAELNPDSAAETFSALSSPELHHLLTVTRGWPEERYAGWLEATVVAAVLGAARPG